MSTQALCEPDHFATPNLPLIAAGQLQRQLLMDRTVDLLVEQAKASEHWPELYLRAQQVLESLALGSDKFQYVSLRLSNAVRYAATGEFGAAAFELRLLRSRLI